MNSEFPIPEWVEKQGQEYVSDWKISRSEWLEKMMDLYKMGGKAREAVYAHMAAIQEKNNWDFDDTVASEWASNLQSLIEHAKLADSTEEADGERKS